MANHVKLVSDGTGNGTKVLIDGKALDLRSLKLEIGANDQAKLTVELYVDEVEIDGAIEVEGAPRGE